jgi:exonuclease SbcD
MKTVKIIQSGDFHLDSPLALHNINFRSQRKEELLSIVERIVTRAIEENAHMILLTGDLFDSSRVSRKTLLFLYKEFMRFSGKIFISPGNHDPNIPDSPYRTFSFPDNVHIFSEFEEVYLEDLDCVVCGVGFTENYVSKSLFENKTCSIDAEIRIMVMHGDVTDGTSEYNPISTESIRKSGYSYIALGHRHTFSGILSEGNTQYAYAGIPEGRGFDELGEKGILVGSIYSKGCSLNFLPLSRRIYEVVHVDVSDLLTEDEIVKKIQSSLGNLSNIYKILLKGSVSPYLSLDLTRLKERLYLTLADFDLRDETIVIEDCASFPPHSLRGIFINLLNEKRDAKDPEFWNEVEKTGLAVLIPGGEK